MRTEDTINDENDDIAFFNRGIHLMPHCGRKLFFGVVFDTAGIDEVESAPGPFGAREVAIAGYTWLVFDNRELMTEHSIEEGRFSYVGSSYYCYCG